MTNESVVAGLFFIVSGVICVFLGIVFIGAGGVGLRENWRLGLAVFIVGVLLLALSQRLIYYSIDLLDPDEQIEVKHGT